MVRSGRINSKIDIFWRTILPLVLLLFLIFRDFLAVFELHSHIAY